MSTGFATLPSTAATFSVGHRHFNPLALLLPFLLHKQPDNRNKYRKPFHVEDLPIRDKEAQDTSDTLGRLTSLRVEGHIVTSFVVILLLNSLPKLIQLSHLDWVTASVRM